MYFIMIAQFNNIKQIGSLRNSGGSRFLHENRRIFASLPARM